MCHRMPVDALLVELLVKIVDQRSQVRFLLTGFHARCVDFIIKIAVSAAQQGV